MESWVVKKACENCSISFNENLHICKTCDHQRFNYCFLNRKNKVVEGFFK